MAHVPTTRDGILIDTWGSPRYEDILSFSNPDVEVVSQTLKQEASKHASNVKRTYEQINSCMSRW